MKDGKLEWAQKDGNNSGQLWFVQDWMKKNPDKAKKSAGFGKEIIHTPC